jgi:uncharacterized protein (DUF488 family)
MNDRPTLFSVGHSTHPIETLAGLLKAQNIACLIDVRSYPSSRRWPQFNQTQLQQSLESAGVTYQWAKTLGGRRSSKRADSPHTAWEHPAFRAYADYAETPGFLAGLSDLMQQALEVRTAIMCSEGLWWRCHRRIISDYVTIRGLDVVHIMPNGNLVTHALPDFATIDDGRIIYDGGQQSLKLK